jgi:SAM-dependent methyltransferase
MVRWDRFNDDVKPLLAGRKTLDIACGNGSNVLRFCGKGSLGIDSSAGAVRDARAGGLNAKKVDAVSYRPTEKFEAVTIFHFLEHLETRADVRKVLATAYEALEPGGLLIVKTPYAYDASMWTTYDHVRQFTMESMRQWLVLTGFEIVDRYTFWHFPFDPHVVSLFGQIKLKCIKRDYLLKLLATFNLIRDLVYIARKPLKGKAKPKDMPHYGF